jgi:hypothetical protein
MKPFLRPFPVFQIRSDPLLRAFPDPDSLCIKITDPDTSDSLEYSFDKLMIRIITWLPISAPFDQLSNLFALRIFY